LIRPQAEKQKMCCISCSTEHEATGVARLSRFQKVAGSIPASLEIESGQMVKPSVFGTDVILNAKTAPALS